MKKTFLNKTGLSMSQAQSISNICYQKVVDIDAILETINNYSKIIKIDGEELIETQGVKMPVNVIDLITLKGKLSATQAFLMENIKAKEIILQDIKSRSFNSSEYIKNNPMPEKEEIADAILLETVSEDYGWEQLTHAELAEYLEVEAMASQIGKFIHKNGKLTTLRTELPTIKTLEWITIKEREKTPLRVVLHHNSSELFSLYEAFAKLHREYEARVNYFKAKVKNLTTLENARINEFNANAISEHNTVYKVSSNKYSIEYEAWRGEMQKATKEFEATKALELKEAAALRITVDVRFQETIDSILETIKMADKE